MFRQMDQMRPEIPIPTFLTKNSKILTKNEKKCWKNLKKMLIFLNLFLLFQNDHKIFLTKSCIQIRWLIWHPVWGSMASSCWGYQYVTSLVVSLPTSTWEQQIMVPFFHRGLVLKNILGLNHLKQKWLI